MYYRTTKLKRYKLLKLILNIIAFPIRFPIFLMCVITEEVGKLLENILDICDGVLWWIMKKISKVCKFDNIADKQYDKNKEKFKTDY